MNILAVDTTTKKALVSIKKDNEIFSEAVDNEITHSEKLLPLIDKTLLKANLSLNKIDKLALINGPGSFTGIRIGLSTLKAFAHVYNLDIISISSLELIALTFYHNQNFKDEKYIVSVIDAKNDRIYYSIFKISSKNSQFIIQNIMDIKNDTIQTAIENIKSTFSNLNINIKDIYLAGILSEEITDTISDFNYLYLCPTTNSLLNIIPLISNIGNYTFNAFNLKAIYARPSQAERVKNGEK